MAKIIRRARGRI